MFRFAFAVISNGLPKIIYSKCFSPANYTHQFNGSANSNIHLHVRLIRIGDFQSTWTPASRTQQMAKFII